MDIISVALQLINFIPLSRGRQLMCMTISALIIFKEDAECLGQLLMFFTAGDLEKTHKASIFFC
jgi:hypothetical protein